MEGMACTYAEQEVEGGTLKWLSKDPCPWISEIGCLQQRHRFVRTVVHTDTTGRELLHICVCRRMKTLCIIPVKKCILFNALYCKQVDCIEKYLQSV